MAELTGRIDDIGPGHHHPADRTTQQLSERQKVSCFT
jgi:hypothetical protein